MCASVRISTNKTYNSGLFILDLNRVPWGCGALSPSTSIFHSSLLTGSFPSRCMARMVDRRSREMAIRTPPSYLLSPCSPGLTREACARQLGEIDIIEGVHDNEHNQVTWHTGPSTLPLFYPPHTPSSPISLFEREMNELIA